MTIYKQIWRIYENVDLYNESKILLSDENFHYIINVLRLKLSEEVEVFNGNGQVGLYEIIDIQKKHVYIKQKTIKVIKKSPTLINLYLAKLKPIAIEEAVSLCAEYGVNSINLFDADKTQIKAEIKLDKLKKICIEAFKINRLSYLTEIKLYKNLENIFNNLASNSLNLVCDEEIAYIDTKIPSIIDSLLTINNYENINIFIGPEASFSEKERLFLQMQNVKKCSLGKKILKSPTAAACAVAVALLYSENMEN